MLAYLGDKTELKDTWKLIGHKCIFEDENLIMESFSGAPAARWRSRNKARMTHGENLLTWENFDLSKWEFWYFGAHTAAISAL